MLSIKPIVDLAAIITLFVGTSMAAAFLEQYGEVQRFQIPVTMLETPPANIVAAGVLFALLIVLLSPATYMHKRQSLSRSRRTIALLWFDVSLVVAALLIISLVLEYPSLVFRSPPGTLGVIVNIFNNCSILLVGFLPIIVLLIALSPIRFVVLLRKLKKMRKAYYASIEADPRTIRQERMIARVRADRLKLRARMRGLRPGAVMSMSFNPSVFYVAYVAFFFLITSYAFGMVRAASPTYSVLAGSRPLLIIAAYPDFIITTCFDEKTHAYAPGYILQRSGVTPSRVIFRRTLLSAPYLPLSSNPKMKC